MEAAFLGVEGGGSKARAVLQHHGRLLARTEWNGINPGDIGYGEFERRLRSLLGPLLATLEDSHTPIHACFALAGVGKPAVRHRCRAIASRVIKLYGARRRLSLMTDADALVETYLHERDGVILIAGTGSIALGVRRLDGRRRVVRVGGRGGLSDVGSGFKIGMGLIEHALRVLDGTEPQSASVEHLCGSYGIALKDVPEIFLPPVRSAVSSLAAIVLEAYREGDPPARSIIAEAVGDLVDMVVRAKQRAGLPDRFHVYLSGGLFASVTFRRLFTIRLRRVLPWMTADNVTEPLIGVLHLTRRIR